MTKLTSDQLDLAAIRCGYASYTDYIAKEKLSFKFITALISVRSNQIQTKVRRLVLRVSFFWNAFYILLAIIYLLINNN